MTQEVVISGSNGTKDIKVLVNDDGSLATGGDKGSFTPRSGSITVGATSQQLMAANPKRKYFIIENPSTLTGQGIAGAELLFISFGAASAGINNGTAIEIGLGGVYEQTAFISTDAIQVNATTTGHRWIAYEA